jgi:hypothetical protein
MALPLLSNDKSKNYESKECIFSKPSKAIGKYRLDPLAYCIYIFSSCAGEIKKYRILVLEKLALI